ncbi:MAG: hyaluronoglucosaminidase [Actinomycetota bacterium]|nr:hyaluronoglucosaminidase [Actinomycetota bacterium]
MDRSVRAADSVVPVLRSFAVRGVVEGFYGTPWTHDARLEVISFLAARGMNAYAYAPKDDARHRAEWRDPYGSAELEQFGELAAHGDACGVQFGFAISPGLDIHYESATDRQTLLRKLAPLRDAGVSWFLLLLDDIPMQPGLASRQAALVTWLHSALGAASLTMCPTEYVGTHPSPYLAELGSGMPSEVDVMWTGPTVCSPNLSADDARGWTRALGDRRVIVWDNYPVNDALMTGSLHLGPYRGRDPDLAEVVGGVLCNPMIQARASQIALGTAMDFLRDPDCYDAASSWAKAIADVGGSRAEPLGVLARACADSPIAEPDTLELARRVDALEAALGAADWGDEVRALRAELTAARATTDAFPDPASPSDPLASEIAPWAAALRRAADAGLAALRLIQAVRPVAALPSPTGAGHACGRAAPPDPEPAMHSAFMVLYVWKGARTDERVVFGPRFAIYTPVVQMPDGAPALDTRAAVREDANVIDRLCRIALCAYDDWRISAAGAPLQVVVDDEERAVAVDGTFDARGRTIIVRQGPISTRVTAGEALPFSDRRLA